VCGATAVERGPRARASPIRGGLAKQPLFVHNTASFTTLGQVMGSSASKLFVNPFGSRDMRTSLRPYYR